MGLSELLQRPRNWIVYDNNMADTLSQVEDGDFSGFQGRTAIDGTEDKVRHIFPYDIVIERMFLWIAANSLTAATTNTMTLRINNVTTAHAITLTSASAGGVIHEITALAQAVPANQDVVAIWNSDSAGTMSLRGIGIAFRIVNPSA